MGSIRDWVGRKLDPQYSVEPIGAYGLEITRPGKPVAKVFCPESYPQVAFDLAHLAQAREEVDPLDFVVIVNRPVADAVYEAADEIGLCIDTFGELTKALSQEPFIAAYRNKEQMYFRQRVARNPFVKSIQRRGARVFEVHRKEGLRPLTVVTIPDYELTSDRVYQILENNEHVKVDAIVSTNPYATGLSPDALEAGRQAGIRVLVFNQLLDQLRNSWN